jgi:hypothetical protein
LFEDEEVFIRSNGEFVRSLHLKLIQKLRNDPEIGPYMAVIAGKAWSRWRKYIPLSERATIHEDVESDLVSAGLLGFAEARSKGRPPDDYIARSMSEAMRDWHNAGGCSGTDNRIRRFIRYRRRWEWAPEWIQLKFPQYTLEQIGAEIAFATPIKPSEMRQPPTEEAECDDEEMEREDVGAQGYPRSGLSQYSRSVGNRQRDWRLAKIISDFERREIHRLQKMGTRAYADWLVNRKSTCPPPPNEEPAPYKPKRYRTNTKKLEAIDKIVRMQNKKHKPKPKPKAKPQREAA